MISCSSPKAQAVHYQEELQDAFRRVLESGWYILGKEVEAFEREFFEFCGVKHCVGVNNGTDALVLALRALDIGPGDEVITVAHTAVATVAAIELVGATPVLVDIEPEFFTIDPKAVEQALTPQTKAIIGVHIYGQPVALEELLAVADRAGIPVIEDCAQAHGAKYRGKTVSRLGLLSCFSFYPTKNLGAIGDGGAVVTSDDALAEKLRLLREYGWKERYQSLIPGGNTRLDELQAAFLRVKLRGLTADNDKRREIAARYSDALARTELILPRTREGCEHVYHLYVVQSARRDELQRHLQARGVQTLIHYPTPIHLQPAYRGRLRTTTMTVTEQAAKHVLSLPIYPELPPADVETVIQALHDF